MLGSWNGLMLSALSRAAMVLDDDRYLAAARRNAEFLLTRMRGEGGRLLRTRREGRSRLSGLLEDHAFVVRGLLDLHEADGDPRWLASALELQDIVNDAFADEARGGYFSFPDDHERLPLRTSSAMESSLPSDVGVALANEARIGLLAGEPERIERARAGLRRHASELSRYPTGFCELLLLIDRLESRPDEVYVVGEAGDPRVERELRALREQWPPSRVFVRVDPGGDEVLARLLPAVEGKDAVEGQPTVYLCHEGVCDAPRVLTE